MKVFSLNRKFVLLLLAGFLLISGCDSEQNQVLRWHAIHVSGEHSSGDAHLLEMPSGDFVLIDTGYEDFFEPALWPYLKKLGVKELALVVVTHAHKNHYGGLIKLAQNLRIHRIAFSAPDGATCARESNGDRCNLEHAESVIDTLSKNSEHAVVRQGDVLYQGGAELRVLHQAQSMDDPRYRQLKEAGEKFTINDSSAVLMLEFQGQKILFPGDISVTTGQFLTHTMHEELKADLLAAPHHGVTPLPGRAFFEKVAPKAIIASISPPPFNSARGQPLRDYAKDANIPIYVTGELGSLIFSIDKQGYSMERASE